MSKVFYDTSAMLVTDIFSENDQHYVVPQVLYELQELKNREHESARAFEVRRAIRAITEGKVNIALVNSAKVESFIEKNNMPDNHDSRIIVGSLLFDNSSMLITYDAAEFLIANTLFPDRCELREHDTNSTITYIEDDYGYTGWVKIYLNEEQLTGLYEDSKINRFHLKVNQYAKLYLENELVDIVRWDGSAHVRLNYKDIKSHYMGTIQPLDAEQKMLFDMLQNKDIKVQMILGSFGCGKSFIALAHAIDFVQRGYYDGIVFVRNNYNLKDTKDIGALPGDELDKLYPFLMPIADHVGGIDGLNMLIDEHVLEPIHLGFLRGRDIQRKIIFCDECENMTRQQMQLLIGRISKGSQLWLIGDRKQTDSAVFERNSGIQAVTEGLAGDPLFAMVRLQESHRSDAAKLADKLD